jgi:hypothetical protein
VIRERNPTEDSRTIARWRAVADKLASSQPPPPTQKH